MNIVIIFIIELVFKTELETWNQRLESVHHILYWSI